MGIFKLSWQSALDAYISTSHVDDKGIRHGCTTMVFFLYSSRNGWICSLTRMKFAGRHFHLRNCMNLMPFDCHRIPQIPQYEVQDMEILNQVIILNEVKL